MVAMISWRFGSASCNCCEVAAAAAVSYRLVSSALAVLETLSARSYVASLYVVEAGLVPTFWVASASASEILLAASV
jgi:hypothetical protein